MSDEPKGAFDDLLAEARSTPEEDERPKRQSSKVGWTKGNKTRARPRHDEDDIYRNGHPTELQPFHYHIIGYVLEGYKQHEVADKVGVGVRTVQRTMKHPEARAMVRRLMEDAENRLHLKFSDVVDRIAELVDHADPRTSLHAIDRWVSVVRQRSPEAPAVSVTVNAGTQQDARTKLVESLRKASDGDGEVIDADPDGGEDGDGEA